MSKTMFVIGEIGRPRSTQYKFISTLTHEFKGMKEVLGYTDMEHAIVFEDKETAERNLAQLPDWAKEKHAVYKVTQGAFGLDYYISHEEYMSPIHKVTSMQQAV